MSSPNVHGRLEGVEIRNRQREEAQNQRKRREFLERNKLSEQSRENSTENFRREAQNKHEPEDLGSRSLSPGGGQKTSAQSYSSHDLISQEAANLDKESRDVFTDNQEAITLRNDLEKVRRELRELKQKLKESERVTAEYKECEKLRWDSMEVAIEDGRFEDVDRLRKQRDQFQLLYKDAMEMNEQLQQEIEYGKRRERELQAQLYEKEAQDLQRQKEQNSIRRESLERGKQDLQNLFKEQVSLSRPFAQIQEEQRNLRNEVKECGNGLQMEQHDGSQRRGYNGMDRIPRQSEMRSQETDDGRLIPAELESPVPYLERGIARVAANIDDNSPRRFYPVYPEPPQPPQRPQQIAPVAQRHGGLEESHLQTWVLNRIVRFLGLQLALWIIRIVTAVAHLVQDPIFAVLGMRTGARTWHMLGVADAK